MIFAKSHWTLFTFFVSLSRIISGYQIRSLTLSLYMTIMLVQFFFKFKEVVVENCIVSWVYGNVLMQYLMRKSH